MFGSIPTTTILPIMAKLGEYLKLGLDQYALLKAAGDEAGPDVIAVFLSAKMEAWDPKIKGKSILDPNTKMAAARFLAGVAVNLAGV